MAFSAKELLNRRGPRGEWSAILIKAGEIPATETEIVVTVVGLDQAPRTFNSPLLLAIEPYGPHGRTAIALNVSNVDRLAKLVGDDLEEVVGKRLAFRRESVMFGVSMSPTLVLNRIVEDGEKRGRRAKK